jgi:multiple sugar transport system permease protein
MAMVGSNRMQNRWVQLYIPLVFFLLFLLFPFYWMLIVSLKPDADLLNTKLNPFLLYHVTIKHYTYLFTNTNFLRYVWNTMVVTVGSTVLALFCSILIGYALGRFRFRGGGFMGSAIFLAYLVPPTLLFIPLSQVVTKLDLYNKYWALILTYPTFLIPFCTWLLIGYFKSIPYELEECALIDGATRLQIMRQITLPLAIPGLISAGIFSFTLSWNEFIYALAFIQSSENKTVPVAILTELVTGDVYQWGALMAGSLLGSLPVAIFYSFFVDYYVSSLTGAVKE